MKISPLSKYQNTSRLPYSNPNGWGKADWTKIPTKNDNLPSQSELKKLVLENAAKYANAESKQEQDELSAAAQDLFTQYVSHGSPDRKSLFENALKTIKTQLNVPSSNSSNKTLIDYLNEAEGKGMKFDKAYFFSGGGSVTAAATTVGTPNFTIAPGGQNLMQIDSRGVVGYFATPTEISLQKGISDIWLSAIHSAQDTPQPKKQAESGINISV